MKKLNSFVLEYRTKKEPTPNVKAISGKDAEKNGTQGLWGIDEPEDDEAIEEPIDPKLMNKNMKRLMMKFKTEEDFFVIGEAGWGKTSIIKNFAKRNKRSVITVYLHQAQAEDLGGIPVPTNSKNSVVQEMAMPAWAKIMLDNPEKKYLLFFDEMNQAAPDVMNALMPIVLEHEICGKKFKNFFVGAAGNFEYENEGGISELSGPLNSRFKPIIQWESGDWASTFNYLKKTWKDKVSEKLLDVLERNANLFVNPRELEHKVIQFAYKLKESGDYEWVDVDDILDRLNGLVKEDLTRTEQNDVKMVAESVYNFIQGKDDNSVGRKSRKDISMVPKNIIQSYTNGMKNGFIDDGNKKYGVSEENIRKIEIDDEYMNAEMLDRLIAKLEADGVSFKYKTDAEWKKAGYADPLED